METINILAIDPGTNMGIVIYTVTVPQLEIVNVTSRVIDLSQHTTNDPMAKNLSLRLQVIRNFIGSVMIEFKPHILAMEAAFVNSRFPKSVMYLSQYIAAVEITCMEHNRFIKIYNYPPKLIKKHIGAGGRADKFDMMDAVESIPEIAKYVKVRLLTEHEIDAMAIGHTLIHELRTYPYLLWIL